MKQLTHNPTTSLVQQPAGFLKHWKKTYLDTNPKLESTILTDTILLRKPLELEVMLWLSMSHHDLSLKKKKIPKCTLFVIWHTKNSINSLVKDHWMGIL